MSTIAALLSQMAEANNIRPWDVATRSQNEADTGLLHLQELKRQQETAARTRQFLQEHPEILLGQGGGSVLGSLGPAGGGPMPPQPGMPGQEPSRYAGVSPQGGGPIPPDMARQVMPQVTPPGGMPGGPQSTLGSLGPGLQPQAPQVDPQAKLRALMQTDPDAAFAVMEQRQKMFTTQLQTRQKLAGAVASQLQSVNSQESYDQVRQDMQHWAPQMVARLPQVYSKDALLPYIKQAFTAQEAAELQIKTTHEQTEQAKLQVQLAQAGYQGLGDDVTGIIRGLSEEQVKQFGGRTTPAAIAYATEEARKLKPVPGQSPDVTTELRAMNKDPWKAQAEDLQQARKNIEARELTRTKAAEVQRGQTERELRGEKTVSEAFGTKSKDLFDTQTGRPIDALIPVKEFEARPKGSSIELSDDNRKQMENVNSALPRLEILYSHIDKVYGPGGVLARMSPEERNIIMSGAGITERWLNQFLQKYPELNAAQQYIDANAETLARALSGVKGAATEGDVERAKAMLPNLTTALNVWPPSKIGVTLPDTQATALRTMNNLTDTLNGIGASILGNKEYRTPLKRYETLTQTAGQASFPPPPTAPPPAPTAAPVPAQPPAAGPPLFPRPHIREPGAPAPALPTAPAAQPTSQAAPAPAPVPAPTTRPAPGKQSQAQPGRRGVELARASGAKVMDAQDIRDAMDATGRSRAEVIKAARARGYTVYSGGTAMV